MILVPVKNLAQAKQRLSVAMPQSARTRLAQAMLLDVLSAISEWGGMPCSVVTGDKYGCDLARRLSMKIIHDAENPGETWAIERATRVCVEEGCESTLVLPADIPLITPGELELIAKHAPEKGTLLVPAGDGRGTNAAYRSPADLFPLRFGNDSFKPHLAAAQALGSPCVVLQLPGIAVDVDGPEDLHQLASLPGETEAQQFARAYLCGADLSPTGTDQL